MIPDALFISLLGICFIMFSILSAILCIYLTSPAWLFACFVSLCGARFCLYLVEP